MKTSSPISIWKEDPFYRPKASCLQVMKALANGVRLGVLEYLTKNKWSTVETLATRFEMSEGAMSKHMRVLLHAHLVTREQIGFYARYELNVPLPRVVIHALKHLSRER